VNNVMPDEREHSEGQALRTMVMARQFAAILGLLLVLVCGLARTGVPEIYTWVDRDGQVHFTDDYALVPAEYRDAVQSRPSSSPADLPLPPTSSAKPKKGKSTKMPSPRLSATGGPAKVVAVLDGDTMVISGGQKVRYGGIRTILRSGLSFDSPTASPSIAWGRDARHYLAHLPFGSEQRNFTLHMVA